MLKQLRQTMFSMSLMLGQFVGAAAQPPEPAAKLDKPGAAVLESYKQNEEWIASKLAESPPVKQNRLNLERNLESFDPKPGVVTGIDEGTNARWVIAWSKEKDRHGQNTWIKQIGVSAPGKGVTLYRYSVPARHGMSVETLEYKWNKDRSLEYRHQYAFPNIKCYAEIKYTVGANGKSAYPHQGEGALNVKPLDLPKGAELNARCFILTRNQTVSGIQTVENWQNLWDEIKVVDFSEVGERWVLRESRTPGNIVRRITILYPSGDLEENVMVYGWKGVKTMKTVNTELRADHGLQENCWETTIKKWNAGRPEGVKTEHRSKIVWGSGKYWEGDPDSFK